MLIADAVYNGVYRLELIETQKMPPVISPYEKISKYMFKATQDAKYSLISAIAFENAEVIRHTHDNVVYWSAPTGSGPEWEKDQQYVMRKALLEGGQESEVSDENLYSLTFKILDVSHI